MGLYVVLGVAGSLMLYVLSIGPVAVLLENSHLRGTDAMVAARVFYTPIIWVCENCALANRLVDACIAFCARLSGVA